MSVKYSFIVQELHVMTPSKVVFLRQNPTISIDGTNVVRANCWGFIDCHHAVWSELLLNLETVLSFTEDGSMITPKEHKDKCTQFILWGLGDIFN